MNNVELHIAPDKTTINVDGALDTYMPDIITFEFWHKDGTYDKTITIEELFIMAGIEDKS